MLKARDRELIRLERRRIIQGLDDDAAAERRYARMDEAVRRELWALRLTFKGLDRACGTDRWKAAAGPRITFRLVGGRLVRETDEDAERKEVTMNGGNGFGEPSSSAAAAGSEDELCSALGSARF